MVVCCVCVCVLAHLGGPGQNPDSRKIAAAAARFRMAASLGLHVDTTA